MRNSTAQPGSERWNRDLKHELDAKIRKENHCNGCMGMNDPRKIMTFWHEDDCWIKELLDAD